MGPEPLLRVTHILVSIGVATLALETLAARRLFSPAGLYPWEILSTHLGWTQRRGYRSGLDILLGFPLFLVLVSVQFLAALALLSGWFPASTLAAVAAMLAVHLLFLLRNQYGLDGSDQMLLLVLAALFVYHLHPTATMLTIAFGFLTGQLLLSYLTSGVAKAISPVWRSGAAIGGILRTSGYGSRALAQFLSARRWAALVVCWGVIGYECGGPLLALITPHAALGFIALGALMHLAIGMCMGLNVFFWAFTATYPAVYYIAQRLW